MLGQTSVYRVYDLLLLSKDCFLGLGPWPQVIPVTRMSGIHHHAPCKPFVLHASCWELKAPFGTTAFSLGHTECSRLRLLSCSLCTR